MRNQIIIQAALLIFISLDGLKAQQTVITTGGNASGSGGMVSYSIGQVIYTSNTGLIGSVEQGVQQPYEISVATGLGESIDISFACLIYPNPTTNQLTLKIEYYTFEKLTYKLFDTNGNLLKENKISGNETTIVMNNLLPSTYFLKVSNAKKVIKIFKIIKN